MPIVQVKGTDQQIKFPDAMDEGQILEVMRQKYKPSNISDALTPIEPSAQQYSPSTAEKIEQKLADVLYNSGVISDRYGAYRKGVDDELLE